MRTLNLEAKNSAQQRIKEYLEQNASEVLAEKINNGVWIEKDGKKFLNKKTLDGFWRYATEEARKIAEKGVSGAYIEDSVVFGWAIHYFEEDSIEGTLYNEDGTEYAKPKPAPQKPKKAKKEKVVTESVTPPEEETKPLNEIPQIAPKKQKPASEQMSIFDLF